MQHSKRYSNFFEDRRRMNNFLENRFEMARHNALFEQGKVTYRMGLNEYSDLSHDEFVSTMNGLRPSTE